MENLEEWDKQVVEETWLDVLLTPPHLWLALLKTTWRPWRGTGGALDKCSFCLTFIEFTGALWLLRCNRRQACFCLDAYENKVQRLSLSRPLPAEQSLDHLWKDSGQKLPPKHCQVHEREGKAKTKAPVHGALFRRESWLVFWLP